MTRELPGVKVLVDETAFTSIFPGLPHVVHTITVQPETVGAVGSVHKQSYVFTDAVVERRHGSHTLTGPYASHFWYNLNLNRKARISSGFTYYFDSFSNIVFVSSSVNGLMLNI